MDRFWYKDAIIYEVHVKAFQDADGDGIGDFRGLTERLDYLQDLGVDCVWLLPFFPSPLRDDGYDIADFYDVSSKYGKMEDFQVFLDEAHRRGLRVIADLVVNHTSDRHPWFQQARSSQQNGDHDPVEHRPARREQRPEPRRLGQAADRDPGDSGPTMARGLGILRGLSGEFLGGLWFVLIGLFLRQAAEGSYQQRGGRSDPSPSAT